MSEEKECGRCGFVACSCMKELRPKAKRGFAAMDPEKRRAIASLGGKRAHEMGVAHCFDTEKAREAGTKGGRAYHKKRGRTVIVGEGQETLPASSPAE